MYVGFLLLMAKTRENNRKALKGVQTDCIIGGNAKPGPQSVRACCLLELPARSEEVFKERSSRLE